MKKVKDYKELQQTIQRKYKSPSLEGSYRAMHTQPQNQNAKTNIDTRNNLQTSISVKDDKRENQSDNFNSNNDQSYQSNRLKSSMNYEKFSNQKKKTVKKSNNKKENIENKEDVVEKSL